MGSIQWTSSSWWGLQYLQNNSKDVVQNIIYSPWGRTKGPWLCLMAKDYFVLLDCFLFFLPFLTSLMKFILWLKFFYRQKAGGGHGWGSILRKPRRVCLFTIVFLTNILECETLGDVDLVEGAVIWESGRHFLLKRPMKPHPAYMTLANSYLLSGPSFEVNV